MPDAIVHTLDAATVPSGRVLDAQGSFGRARDDLRGFHGLLGRSPVMQALFRSVERLAPQARATLITGDTGVGKSLLASVAHRLGPCRGGAQIVMPGAHDAAEIECLREAARGMRTPVTCFVPELADLTRERQAELVRALAGSADLAAGDGLHVVASTGMRVRDEMAAGRLREDLFYRLGVVHFHMPTLAERPDDLADLAAALLRDGCRRLKLVDKSLSGAAQRLLDQRHWAGNVRELQNVMLRAAALTDDAVIGAATVREACGPTGEARREAVAPAGKPDPDGERQRVTAVLKAVGGNKSAAAAHLGVSRRAFYRMLERLGA